MTCPVHTAPNEASPRAGQVPKDVLAYVKRRKATPSESYAEVWAEEHAVAFAVARAGEKDLVQDMQDAVKQALAEGLPFKEFAKRLTPTLQDKGWWGKREDGVQLGSPHRLKIIYDTNVRVARAAGQWKRIQEAKASLPYLRYRHGNPQRPRPDHESWDGRVLPVDHPFWDYAYPPNGYLCFLPGTRIEGSLIGASKAWYSGQAFELRYASGARLTVTLNHPVATPQGWSRAQDLQVGQHCFRTRSESKFSILGGVDNQNIPAKAEDIFDAWLPEGSALDEVSPLEFHAEASRFVGKVQVVGTYRALAHRRIAYRAQRVKHALLSVAEPAPILPGHGRGGQLGVSVHSASRSNVCTCEHALSGSVAGATPVHSLGLAVRAYGYATPSKESVDGCGRDTVEARQLAGALAGQVALDEIVGIRRFEYSGHVFDFESSTGTVAANGILASNCTCWVEQVSRSQAKQLGVTPDSELDMEPILVRNKTTGKVTTTIRGVDPTFAYNPGKARLDGLKQAGIVKGKASTPKPAPAPVSSADALELVGGGAALPQGFSISVTHTEDTKRGLRVAAAIKDADGRVVGSLLRTFRPGGVVEHSSFLIDQEHQGSGLGAAVFNAQIEAYRRTGKVHTVVLDADNLGRYVWSKAGFSWSDTDRAALLSRLETKLLTLASPSATAKILAKVRTPQDVAGLVVRGQKIGKDLLIEYPDVVPMSQAVNKIKRL